MYVYFYVCKDAYIQIFRKRVSERKRERKRERERKKEKERERKRKKEKGSYIFQ